MSDRDRAIECLRRLAPERADNRDMWLRVGMALHAVSPDLLAEWNAWSELSDKYQSGECQRQWKGFRSDGGLGMGSLRLWASEDDPSGQASHRQAGAASQPKATPPATTPGSETPRTYATWDAIVQALAWQTGGTYEAHWTYQNEDGTEALRVIRLRTPEAPGKKPKTYRPVHPVSGGWVLGDPEGLLPLYNLLAIRDADAVAILEGEKCADLAASIGLVATTSCHGAQSAHKTDWSPLAGKAVTIYPDHDKDGDKYAVEVAAILGQLNPPAKVRIVDLPVGDGQDLEQWLAPRESQEPETIRAALEALTPRATPVVDGPILTCMADVEPRKVEWLWPGKVPLGSLTLLVGVPGVGKSYLAVDAAARVSTGVSWPDGMPCPRGSAILISAEDDPATAIRPRLDAHRANVHRVHLLSTVRRTDKTGKSQEDMFTLEDVAALETAIRSLPDVRLIVIDPVGSFVGGRTDTDKDNKVRAVLAPVAVLAAKCKSAVLVVAHRRKGTGATADELAMGSRAFTGIARAVWHVSVDRDQPERRLFLPGKINIARQSEGFAFSIVGDPVGRVCWGEKLAMTADDALALEAPQEHRRPGPEPEARNKAMAWLATLLASGPMRTGDEEAPESGTVVFAARQAGHSWATVRRAMNELRIEAYRESFGGPWMWRLPKMLVEDAHAPLKHNDLSVFGQPEHLPVLEDASEELSFPGSSDYVEDAQDAQVVQVVGV